MHRFPLVRLVCALAALATAGCSSPDSLVGPCIVYFREPLLGIPSVVDAATGAAIPQVRISDITINGTLMSAGGLAMEVVPPATGVVLSGDTVVCDIACGFAISEGTYAFRVSAAGHRDTVIEQLSAHYTNYHGNCPLYISGGITLPLSLRPSLRPL
jgi:hypothetical protein